LSFTVVASAVPKFVLTVALCVLPPVAAMVVGGFVLLSEKIAVDVVPWVDAVTMNAPTVPFDVNAGDTAVPVESVLIVADVFPFAKVPPAPPSEGVTVNVTGTLPAGVPFVATRAVNGET